MGDRTKRGRGEGSIETLPNGKHRARVRYGTDPATGKERRESKVFKLVSDARTWLREKTARKDRGALPVAAADTVAEWAAVWLAECRTALGHGTVRNYAEHLRLYVIPRLGALKLRDVTAAHVAALRDAVAGERTPATARKVLVTLSVLFGAALKRQMIFANPVRGVKRPKKVKADVEVLTGDEARAVLGQLAGRRLEPLYRLLFDAGCRPGEAMALHWPDFDPVAGAVRITKSLEKVWEKGEAVRKELKPPKTPAGNRTVKLSAGTVSSLLSHRDRMKEERRDTDQGPVFVNEAGNWIDWRNTSLRDWKPALERAGVPYREPYAMRHTSATLMLAAGVSLKAVSRRLGHEDILTTLQHYGHCLPDDDDKCSAVMHRVLGGPGDASGSGAVADGGGVP